MAGGPRERDAAYHQGTVWPWLIGPFVNAYLRVNGHGAATRAKAKALLEPLLEYLHGDGVGQIPEVFDCDPPHRPGGCIAQAWSVAEVVRITAELAEILAAKKERGMAPLSLPLTDRAKAIRERAKELANGHAANLLPALADHEREDRGDQLGPQRRARGEALQEPLAPLVAVPPPRGRRHWRLRRFRVQVIGPDVRSRHDR